MKQKERSFSFKNDDNTITVSLEVHITIGEPLLQVITNWATTKGTT